MCCIGGTWNRGDIVAWGLLLLEREASSADRGIAKRGSPDGGSDRLQPRELAPAVAPFWQRTWLATCLA